MTIHAAAPSPIRVLGEDVLLSQVFWETIYVEPGEWDEESAFRDWAVFAPRREALADLIATQETLLHAAVKAARGSHYTAYRSVASAYDLVKHARTLTGLQKVSGLVDYLAGVMKDKFTKKAIVVVTTAFVAQELQYQLKTKVGRTFYANTITLYQSLRALNRRLKRFHAVARRRLMIVDVATSTRPIDLSDANHMIFVQYAFDPHENARLILRMHHEGQKHNCRVTFVALKGSWDEPLCEAARAETVRATGLPKRGWESHVSPVSWHLSGRSPRAKRLAKSVANLETPA
jgi:hypothetical protein